MAAKLISVDAGNLIIEQEVTSRAVYIKKYQRPELPGGASGITVGIGYDCGQTTAAQIRKDWAGRIPDPMIATLCSVAGLKGRAAQNMLAAVQHRVSIPWDAAIGEFYDVEVPRWLGKVRAALPNLDLLPPDCIGALVSLAYNRGPSFTIAPAKDPNGRYFEMRAIRAHMVAKEFFKIPTEFRKMKRLWVTASVRGVATRREAEARLFERGLAAMPAAVATLAQEQVDDAAADAADDQVIAPAGEDAPAPTASDTTIDNPDLFAVKRRLKAMNYTPGVLNGEWGGMTAGAIAGFINDRGGHIAPPASLDAFNHVQGEIEAELDRAENEKPPFVRPVSEARKSADPAIVATVAPEVVPAKRSFWAMLSASIAAAFGSVWDTISGWAGDVWNFFTDHKDDLPGDSSSFLGTAWDYVKEVPSPVWWLLAAGVLVALALDARKGIKKITESVSTGARQ
jgi:hypothetical protein